MSGHGPADQVDVRLLAGLQHAQLDVLGGQLGDQPVRVGLWPVHGVVPGRPALTGVRVGLAVRVGERLGGPPALQKLRFVVVEAALAAGRRSSAGRS